MTGKKLVTLLLLLLFFNIGAAFAQAPVITYSPQNSYTTNAQIVPLIPSNSSGAVPATVYGSTTTFAGSSASSGNADGQGTAASFYAPDAITTDAAGNIYVGEQGNNTVRKITPAGLVTTLAAPVGVFNYPAGLVVDNAGNIFVADYNNNVIREISAATGLVSTFAGSGAQGSADGTGILASFNRPDALAIDAAGNIYVADYGNRLIRKITPAGIVSTLPINTGGAFIYPTGIAIDASGNLYVANQNNNTILKVTQAGTVSVFAGSGNADANDGTGTAASFNHPTGISIDKSGTLFVADENNNNIRQISPAGVVTTVSGGGQPGSADGPPQSAAYTSPAALVNDNNGHLFVADLGNNEIREVTLTGYAIDKPLPPGLSFNSATGVISGTPTAPYPKTVYTVTAYNAAGNGSFQLTITVTGKANGINPPNISYTSPQSFIINTMVSTAPANVGGNVPPAIYSNVTAYAGGGAPGNTNGVNPLSDSFNTPTGVAADAGGNIYVADLNNNIIRKISAGTNGKAGAVSTFAGNGTVGKSNGPGTTIATFNKPYDVVTDAAGNIYVSDFGNNIIRKITPGGQVTTFAGSGTASLNDGPAATAGFNGPAGLAIDASGNIYVADSGNNAIREISPAGMVITIAGNGSAGFNNAKGVSATYNDPTGLGVDATGNVFVADAGNNLIREISPAGVISTFAGSSGVSGNTDGTGTGALFNSPRDVKVDGTGNLYVTDYNNNTIRKITPAGVVTTVAGNGEQGNADAIGTAASFNHVTGLTTDANGNLFIGDTGNNEVREVSVSGYTIDKTLPAGLSFDPTTGIISGKPAVLSPATDYIVTAYNAGGSSVTVVNIAVIKQPAIVFAPIPVKTLCDADFNPGAVSNLPINYTSGNLAVATIIVGEIHIVGPGKSAITADDGNTTAVDTLTVLAKLTPTISISPPSLNGCIGASYSFTATITNGGTSPSYQWQVNGINQGTNSPRFTTSALLNGDDVTCILTSNAICTTSAKVTSNISQFTGTPSSVTQVIITSSADGPVCAGADITFTALAITPDTNPNFQWLVNGKDAGTNSFTFTSNSLSNNDVVTCLMSSVGTCLVNSTVASNAIYVEISKASGCVILVDNAFTPNGDGINDTWDMPFLAGYPGCTVMVYNRYGALVFNSVNYPKPWDGTYNGKALPVGTYYYIINLKTSRKPIGGSVTIIK